jgi:drug/metabolite transporter (DMT)-like permease
MFTNPRSLGVGALLFAAATWGVMFIVSKDVLEHVDAVWFTLIRYLIAGGFLAALLLPRGAAPWRNLRANATPLALRGAFGFGVFSVALLTGLAHTQASHGAVIMATTPITTQLLRWVLDGIKPARVTLATSVLALAGVVTVSGLLAHDPAAITASLTGDALILGSTVAWVWYTRGAAEFPHLETLEYTALTVLAALPLLLIGALLATGIDYAHAPSADELRTTWHALLFVGVVASGIAIVAFNYGVRSLGAVGGTAFLNFVPVSALLAGAALGHAPSASELAGAAMVIGALLVHTAATLRASPARAPAPAGKPRIAAPLRPAGCTQTNL